jgi:hypothetical protein
MAVRYLSLLRLAREEEGGAYTLSYVMVVPVITLLMCLIVESALMLSAKLGTVYAAYVGARVATVWSSAANWERAEERIEQAAVRAFVPFASGGSSRDDGGEANVARFVESYRTYADRPVADAYVSRKYQNAAAAVTVRTDGPPPAWDAAITVTVRYEYPFRVPGIGRLLGEKGANGGYHFPVASRITLQNEGPQNDSQDLGIGYGTLD